MSTLNPNNPRHYFAHQLVQNGGKLSDEFQARAQADRQFQLISRFVGSMPCQFETCPDRMMLRRDTKATKMQPNPMADQAVPFGGAKPAAYDKVRNPAYGRYAYMCSNDSECHPAEKAGKDGSVPRDKMTNKPKQRMSWIAFADAFRGVHPDSLHPAFAKFVQAQLEENYDFVLSPEDMDELEAPNASWARV